MTIQRGRMAAAILGILALLCLLFPPAAHAQEDVVRVGYVLSDNYQEGGDGEYKSGFGYEYLQRVSYATGWEYEYVYGSFSELFAMLQRGEIDLMGDISYTEARAETILYPALPQGREKFFIYTTPDQGRIDPYDSATLNGCRIGVTTGSYQYGLLEKWLQEHQCESILVDYPGSNALVDALTAGEIDAMVMTDMASHRGFLPVANIGFSEFYFGVSRARTDLLTQLDQALLEIQTIDPFYNEKVYAKYNNSTLSTTYLNAEERSWLEEHGSTVRLGYLVSNLPYSDQAEDGSLRGLLSVLVRTFEEDFGIRVETMPFPTLEAMVEAVHTGGVDLFGPMLEDYWLAEQNGLLATDPFTETTCILLYQGDYDESMTEVISWYNGNAVQRGAVEVLYPDAALVECSSREDSLQAVLDGRAGCTIVSAATLNLLRQYRAMDSLNMLELPAAADVCLGVVRGNSELLNITNRVIFTSSEDLTGVALMENIRSRESHTLLELVEEHSMAVIGVLLCVIALLVGSGVFYLLMNRRLARMQIKNEELSRQAFRDSLTKVGNRAGYLSRERELQQQLEQGEVRAFGMVVADVNDLKAVNDRFGHEQGDTLIRNASQLICRIYDHSPVYRIGGDEFVVLLTGSDYENREALLAQLAENDLPCTNLQQLEEGGVSLAYGMAVYDSGSDNGVKDVFQRADKAMYECKKRMKAKLHPQ